MKTTIFEYGIPLEIEQVFADSLCEQQPEKYKKENSLSKSKLATEDLTKENLKVQGEGTPANDADGKFTIEDLKALKFEGIKEICKKLKIPVRGKKREILIEEIWEISQKTK
jgi:hypothetical protein